MLLAVSLLVTVAGCDSDESGFGEGVLATVGGHAITVDDYKAAAKGVVPSQPSEKQGLLAEIINNRLVFNKAHAEGFEMVQGFNSMLQNVYVERLPAVLIRKVTDDIKVSDEELEMHRPTDTVTMLNVTMLVAKSQDDAETLHAELKGGVSFDEVAKKHKDKLQEAVMHDRQVSLKDDLYPIGVRAALNKLKPGELSPVMKLEVGYAVFRLDSRVEPGAQWEKRKESVRADIKRQNVDRAEEELVQRLGAEAKIEIKDTPDGPIAVVDGTTISVAEMMTTQKTDDPHAPHTGMNPQTVRGALNKAIKGFLLAKEARRLGLDKDPDIQRAVRLETERVVAEGYLNKMSEGLTATPEDIQQYYDKNKDRFTTRGHTRVSRILLNTQKDADAVLEKLKAGGDFAKLAAQYSQDEASAENGGDVGFVDLELMKEPMRNVVEGLKVGDASAPVKSDYGFEILMVTEKRPASVRDLADVRETIAKRVLLEKRSVLVEDLYDKLNKEYPVRINTKLLESLK